MGQVFTWDEVKNGRVPKLADFTKVVEQVLPTMADEESIEGAIVCGSVTRGDHTLRSDIDLFVRYDHENESEAFVWMQSVSATAKMWHVPLCCIPCDTLLAKTRMHHIGQSFHRHLEKSALAGGLLKGDPLASLAPSVSEAEEIESYLRVKMYNLQEAWSMAQTFSEERMASYLKKLLEAPMHIARKTLAHQAMLGDDSKSQICVRYAEVMPRAMAMQFKSLVETDTEYTEALRDHRRSPREKSYRRQLVSILARSEDVLAFIRANLAFVAEKAR